MVFPWLKADSRIQAEIEAYQLANEAAKYRSSESLRNLVIQSLVQVVLSPTAKESTKVGAAKVLVTVVGVDAFVERKQITHVQDSKAIRDKILGELKTITLNLDDALDVDATALLAELAGDDDSQAAEYDAIEAAGGGPRRRGSLHAASHARYSASAPRNPITRAATTAVSGTANGTTRSPMSE